MVVVVTLVYIPAAACGHVFTSGIMLRGSLVCRRCLPGRLLCILALSWDARDEFRFPWLSPAHDQAELQP